MSEMTRLAGLIFLLGVIIAVHGGLPKRSSDYLKNNPQPSSIKNLLRTLQLGSQYSNLKALKQTWKPVNRPHATRPKPVPSAVRTSNYEGNHLPNNNNPENTFGAPDPNIINLGVVAPAYDDNLDSPYYSHIRSQQPWKPANRPHTTRTKPVPSAVRTSNYDVNRLPNYNNPENTFGAPVNNLASPYYSHIRSQQTVSPGSAKPHYSHIRSPQHSYKDERHNLYEKEFLPSPGQSSVNHQYQSADSVGAHYLQDEEPHHTKLPQYENRPHYAQDIQRHSLTHHDAIEPHHHRRRPLSAVEQHSSQAFRVGKKPYIPATPNHNGFSYSPRNVNNKIKSLSSKLPKPESRLQSSKRPMPYPPINKFDVTEDGLAPNAGKVSFASQHRPTNMGYDRNNYKPLRAVPSYLHSIINEPQKLQNSNVQGSFPFNTNFVHKPLFDFRRQNHDIPQQIKFSGSQQMDQNSLNNISPVTGMRPNLRYQSQLPNPMPSYQQVNQIKNPNPFYKKQGNNYLSAIPHVTPESASYPSQQTSLGSAYYPSQQISLGSAYYPSQQTSLQPINSAGTQSTMSNLYSATPGASYSFNSRAISPSDDVFFVKKVIWATNED